MNHRYWYKTKLHCFNLSVASICQNHSFGLFSISLWSDINLGLILYLLHHF